MNFFIHEYIIRQNLIPSGMVDMGVGVYYPYPPTFGAKIMGHSYHFSPYNP